MRAQPAAFDLVARLSQQRSFFGAVEPEHGRCPAAMRTSVRTQRDVFDHAARAQQADMLKGAGQPERGESSGR